MSAKQKSARQTPSLKDEIAASGETAVDSVRAALREESTDNKFLGREFLTWLIFHADDDTGGGGQFQSADGEPFSIQLGERMVLRGVGEGAGEIAAKGPGLSQTADVLYAIAGGMTVREIDCIIEIGERSYTLALSAELFDVKRAKLPGLMAEDDDAKAVERLQLLGELEGLLKAAFRAFLQQRVSPAWDRDHLPRMREFLARAIKETEGRERPGHGHKTPRAAHNGVPG